MDPTTPEATPPRAEPSSHTETSTPATPATPPYAWGGAVAAGLLGGAAFILMQMLMVWLIGGKNPWGPPTMIGAIAMGHGVLPPAGLDIAAVAVGLAIHFALAVVYALVFVVVFGRLSGSMLMLLGVVAGLVLYAINFFGFTALFPWFAASRIWITVVTHVVFGLVVAWSYAAMRSPSPALTATARRPAAPETS